MKAHNHTPGPWYIAADGQANDGCRIITGENHFIFRIEGADMARQEDQANSRLIASAPELLAAMQRLVRAVSEHRLSGITISSLNELVDAEDQAIAAITKATSQP